VATIFITKDNPDRPEDNPNQPEDNPDQPEDNPNQPEDNPDQPEDNPDQPEDNPNQPEDNPDHYQRYSKPQKGLSWGFKFLHGLLSNKNERIPITKNILGPPLPPKITLF
jgi:hypothetical protein